jgi:hypothetical protein
MGAGTQRRENPHQAAPAHRGDGDDVEQAVVQGGIRADPQSPAIAGSVADRDQNRLQVHLAVPGLYPHRPRSQGGELGEHCQIVAAWPGRPAHRVGPGVHRGIETGTQHRGAAGSALNAADVDAPPPSAAQRVSDMPRGEHRIARDAQRGGQIVAGSAG